MHINPTKDNKLWTQIKFSNLSNKSKINVIKKK